MWLIRSRAAPAGGCGVGFAELTRREPCRSAHRSMTQLEAGIRRWISEWNACPKPFIWAKTADEILESAASYRQRTTTS